MNPNDCVCTGKPRMMQGAMIYQAECGEEAARTRRGHEERAVPAL